MAVSRWPTPSPHSRTQQDQPDQQDQQARNRQEGRQSTGRRTTRSLKNELDSQYKKWLNEDVIYIITPEERNAFLHLSTNEEREQFIEAFWQRRNPDPDSPENTFKEEHYRRIAYANEHYASGIPGWKTDRGRIYIMWGPPDEIDSHPTGGTYDRPSSKAAARPRRIRLKTGATAIWKAIGENVELEFVDPTSTGEYHLTMDPSEKDALLRVPGAGLTMAESMGMAEQDAALQQHRRNPQRAEAMGGCSPRARTNSRGWSSTPRFNRPPPVKFKDLEAVVTSRLVRDQVKFDYRFDFLRITSDTVLVPITVQISSAPVDLPGKGRRGFRRPSISSRGSRA